MSAVVCSKRSSSIFGDDLVPSPSSPSSPTYHYHHPAKRARCTPTRRSEVLLHHLFPDMDPQLLEKALEASGDDLDSAIKRLNELRLESAGAILSATVCDSEKGISSAHNLLAEGTTSNGHLDIATENPPAIDNSQTSHHSSEWVDLFVKEMMSSSNIDDARARASRALVEFEKSIMDQVGAEAVQNLHRENVMLKEQLAIILRENAVLKRGVAIQHERQKEFDVRTQEVNNLKEMVLQYQEQLRTLEINNYALRVHLKLAQQNNSMPGRFPPDVF